MKILKKNLIYNFNQNNLFEAALNKYLHMKINKFNIFKTKK